MSITLTLTYEETLRPETVALIKEYEQNDFELTAMLAFIDENSEADFQEFYEIYVELGEDHGYEPVDAFLKIYDADMLEYFESAYIGEFVDKQRMAEEYLDCEAREADIRLIVDWEETANYLMMHEVDNVGCYYFRSI